MTYIEGGVSNKTADNIIISALSAAIGAIAGHAIKNSLIGFALKSAGFWVAGVIDSIILTLIASPSKLFAVTYAACAAVVVIDHVYQTGARKGYWKIQKS